MEDQTFMNSAEEQLKLFGTFLQKHEQKLVGLLQRVPECAANKPQLLQPLVAIDYSTNREELTFLRFLESERVLNKTLLTFAFMCAELDEACAAARELQLKLLLLDEDIANLESDAEEAIFPELHKLLKMSEHLNTLYDIHFLLQRFSVLGNNLLHQCGAFLADTTALELKMNTLFDTFANLLLELLVFSEILLRCNIAQCWPQYKRTLETILQKTDLDKSYHESDIRGMLNCIKELDVLFAGNVFRNFMDSMFMLKDRIGSKGMGQLATQVNDYMKQRLADLDRLNFTADEFSEWNDALHLVRLNAYCVVMHDFCGQIESRHVKHLLELNAKHQGIVLLGNIIWSAAPFLQKYAETLMRSHSKLLQLEQKERQQFLPTRLKTLQRDVQQYRRKMILWHMQVNKLLSVNVSYLKTEHFKELATMLLQGMHYAIQLNFHTKALIQLHVSQQMLMTRATLLSICTLMQLLSAIQQVFQAQNAKIAEVMHCIVAYMQYKLLQLLTTAEKKFKSAKMHDKNVDALAALRIAQKCLQGPATLNRALIAQLAIEATNGNNRILSNEQHTRFDVLLQRLRLLAEFQLKLKEVSNTHYIYWHQSLFSSYMRNVVENRLDFQTFQHLIKSNNECNDLFERLHLSELQVCKDFKKSTYDLLRNEIISKLCAEIETFLRLEVHADLQVEQMSPFAQNINEYYELLHLCPLIVNDECVVLRDHIENYLGTMFYNLTTISLHDWKTYEHMRHLANSRLDLHPVEDYLPNQTLEQGIDILEIMRQIHIFVSRYVYNMNAQLFVEQKSNNKHLESIGIEHVANSIRTHGLGVINTTVNFIYQYLRQKFYTFSQFLYDENIRSRIMKELTIFAERKKTDSYPLYVFERAEAFNKDMRKLGLAENDLGYMDLFRLIVTHVGNAMGYIRLVRSGSMDANYSASLFLPKFDEELKFVSQCEHFEPHTKTAAHNFEENIKSLCRSFSNSTDFFKLLVDAFQPFMQHANNLHLKNFFLIVPALTMNYVEYMLAAKEKIHKKDVRQEAVLFDDGFAVGLAYILKLLSQVSDFNSLQWFSTVKEHFELERKKIQQKLQDLNGRKKVDNSAEFANLQQTLALSDRRINAHQMEYNQLYFNMSSAKIFFN